MMTSVEKYRMRSELAAANSQITALEATSKVEVSLLNAQIAQLQTTAQITNTNLSYLQNKLQKSEVAAKETALKSSAMIREHEKQRMDQLKELRMLRDEVESYKCVVSDSENLHLRDITRLKDSNTRLAEMERENRGLEVQILDLRKTTLASRNNEPKASDYCNESIIISVETEMELGVLRSLNKSQSGQIITLETKIGTMQRTIEFLSNFKQNVEKFKEDIQSLEMKNSNLETIIGELEKCRVERDLMVNERNGWEASLSQPSHTSQTAQVGISGTGINGVFRLIDNQRFELAAKSEHIGRLLSELNGAKLLTESKISRIVELEAESLLMSKNCLKLQKMLKAADSTRLLAVKRYDLLNEQLKSFEMEHASGDFRIVQIPESQQVKGKSNLHIRMSSEEMIAEHLNTPLATEANLSEHITAVSTLLGYTLSIRDNTDPKYLLSSIYASDSDPSIIYHFKGAQMGRVEFVGGAEGNLEKMENIGKKWFDSQSLPGLMAAITLHLYSQFEINHI